MTDMVNVANRITKVFHDILEKISEKISIRWYKIIISALMIISIFPLLYAGKAVSLYSDDVPYVRFTSAAWDKTHSVGELIKAAFKTDIEYYLNWQGLYSSAFLQSLHPGIFGESYNQIASLIIISAMAVGLLTLLTFISIRFLETGAFEGLFAGVVLLFLALQTLPDVENGIYWYNGAVNYAFYWSLECIFIFFVLRYHTEKKGGGICFILAVLTGFLLEGGNHVTAFSGMLFIGAAAVYDIIEKNRGRTKTAILFLVVLGGLLLNVLSPGTSHRKVFYTEGYGVMKSIIASLTHGVWTITEWTDLKMLYIFLILLPVFLPFIKGCFSNKGFRFPLPGMVLIISFLWVCALYCPGYYSMGYSGTPRIETVVYFTYIVLFYLNAFYLTGWVYGKSYSLRCWEIMDSHGGWLLLAGVAGFFLFIAGVRSNAYWALKAVKQGTLEEFVKNL